MSDTIDPSRSPDEMPAPATSSLPARLFNIYAAPGDVFDEVRVNKFNVANWLVPVLLGAVTAVISVWVIFSQPAVQQQVREQQAAQFQKLVDEGKMKQEDADRMQEQMEKFGMTMTRVAGSIGAFLFSFGWLFLIGLVLWLLGRFGLGGQVSYPKLLEVAGLSGMIMWLGGIITTLLIVVTGRMFANVGPSLLMSEFDATNKIHLLLGSLNLFTLWYIGILSMGLAKLTGASFLKAALWMYGLWAGLRLAIIFSGLGAGGM